MIHPRGTGKKSIVQGSKFKVRGSIQDLIMEFNFEL
jgi:hypothetical protein